MSCTRRVLPRLSRPDCTVHVVLAELSYPDCPFSPTVMAILDVQAVLTSRFCRRWPVHANCQAGLSSLSCPSFLVPSFMHWLYCPATVVLSHRSCHVLVILSIGRIQAVLSWLSCPVVFLSCHVLAILSSLSCHGCPFLFVLRSYLVLIILFCLSCPSTIVPSFPVPACPVLAVMFWLSCFSVLSPPSVSDALS